jgi:hypothetical protein
MAIRITRTKGTNVAHPVYFPDARPCDFVLFAHLTREMATFTLSPPADIIPEIHRIFVEISFEILTVVYNEWITWLEWIAWHKGEYNH